MTEPLPRVGGRAPRVALLVYNDAHADARVIKTATSLRSAGAEVRIFAVARARAGYAEGPDTVGEGIEVQRAPEFELIRYAPWAVDLARRVLGRQTPVARGTADQTSPGTTEQAPSRPEPAVDIPTLPARPTAKDRVLLAANDVWLRTFRTANLGLYWLEAAREAIAWRPDVVHANDGNTLAPAWWISARTGARVVYDAHELWRHRNVRTDRPVAPLVETAIESTVIRRAAGVITVSPSIVDWYRTAYRLPEAPTLVRNIPSGAGGPVDPARGRLRELAGLGPDSQVVAYGGRITTSRGIEETLEAMALLPEGVHFVLLGYGEPDYLAVLHERIGRLGLGERVHFVGKVAPSEVATALADADLSVVYVRPVCLSYEFSLPNKLFESIHGGLPIAAADLPDTAAVVREHGVGEIFDAQSPADMAATMSTILDDPERYRAAARRAATELTWEHEEAELLGLYARVLAGSGRP
ncbi:glycosyltransferase [Ornithinicoccus hortensis]|uniref:Glycosyltransferase involved in cell wall biosynthesis n=1 Tax=Ornithinicoccus hortensis TaxID=82346 RepID=A0A542YTK2_9MICO|nr:glycosyltransferase [Ornithinicoccus hortensis]TQL51425.1 glycosyltransferase involved in cell wall biosynthesis [Ornithinicoccus hortensis]